jgi:hypothetical protein
VNHLAGLGPEELRDAVRAVLREVLPPGTVADAGTGTHDVVIATDADLTAFLRRVAALCEDDQVRAALQAGRHEFRLAGRSVVSTSSTTDQTSSTTDQTSSTTDQQGAVAVRVERGAVTERTVVKAAADGARLVLGRRAVLTPLAKDKARSLGVEIEKEG